MCVCLHFVQAVSANSEKIAAEELQCKAMAENAQRDLDEALPALQEAMKVGHQHKPSGTLQHCLTLPDLTPPTVQALESLNKKDMTEIKSYGRPPPLVEKVMAAVMTLQCKEPTWAEAKRQLGEEPRPETHRAEQSSARKS